MVVVDAEVVGMDEAVVKAMYKAVVQVHEEEERAPKRRLLDIDIGERRSALRHCF